MPVDRKICGNLLCEPDNGSLTVFVPSSPTFVPSGGFYEQ